MTVEVTGLSWVGLNKYTWWCVVKFARGSLVTLEQFAGRRRDHEKEKRNAIGARSSAHQPVDPDQQVGQAA